ncbi:HAD-IIB family hydrolase [Abyssicoccus albus]|uniref:HAD-IIB family hydrolase n=1 Tax=Abyssicoccus albus TaxID=1817405 RepID=UPI00097E247D|nr:HAD family hydrolase [Abyssicoccus albus]AQL55977.1 hydrolase [Abyssicoccus albus]
MIFVFDVDGTICFDGQTIENSIKEAIFKIREHHDVVFASARPIRDLLPVVNEFNGCTLIGGNGSIVSKNDEIEVMDYISDHDYSFIKKLIKDYSLNYIIDGSFDYSAKIPKDNMIAKQLDPANLAHNIGMDEIRKPIKIILIGIAEEYYEKISNLIKASGDGLSINFHDAERNIDITSTGINKYTTFKRLFGETEYIAFGNDINDYELLKHAQQAHYVSDLIEEVVLKEVEVIKDDVRSIGNLILRYL